DRPTSTNSNTRVRGGDIAPGRARRRTDGNLREVSMTGVGQEELHRPGGVDALHRTPRDRIRLVLLVDHLEGLHQLAAEALSLRVSAEPSEDRTEAVGHLVERGAERTDLIVL